MGRAARATTDVAFSKQQYELVSLLDISGWEEMILAHQALPALSGMSDGFRVRRSGFARAKWRLVLASNSWFTAIGIPSPQVDFRHGNDNLLDIFRRQEGSQ